MELRHLRTFLAVFEEGSITAAARRLHVAQPAVTRQIRQLEASVGQQLFGRSPQGVTPTSAGARLEPEARLLIARADTVVDDLRHDRTALGGTLKIAVPEEGLGTLTPIVLAAYKAAHPNVAVIVDTDCGYDSLSGLVDRRNSEFDVALWALSPEFPQLSGSVVYRERLKLAVAAESDLGRASGPLPTAEVLEKPFVDAGSFMFDYAHFAYLSAFRNGARPRLAAEAATGIDGLRQGIANGSFVAAMTPSTPPMPGVTLAELVERSHVEVGVVHHRGEQRQHVKNFASIAAAVGEELYRLVPEALPPHVGTTKN